MATKKGKKKTGEDFPGYLKYGTEEDITHRASRVDENLDDEILTQVMHREELKPSKLSPNEGANDQNNSLEGEERIKNNFDVTKEDLEALGPEDLSMDMGDDEQLKHRVRPVDFTGEDLDTPGTELDDDQEEVGSEDEENNN